MVSGHPPVQPSPINNIPRNSPLLIYNPPLSFILFSTSPLLLWRWVTTVEIILVVSSSNTRLPGNYWELSSELLVRLAWKRRIAYRRWGLRTEDSWNISTELQTGLVRWVSSVTFHTQSWSPTWNIPICVIAAPLTLTQPPLTHHIYIGQSGVERVILISYLIDKIVISD